MIIPDIYEFMSEVIVEGELKDSGLIQHFALDYLKAKADAIEPGKSIVTIEGSETTPVYYGRKHFYNSVDARLTIFSRSKEEGIKVKNLILAQLEDYGFRQQQSVQSRIFSQTKVDSKVEQTVVDIECKKFNGIPYFRKNK